ncbi:hypothetical protein [Demequina sediminicola]|uniref:hypothetical protein n=1 Tax=Demequina sediminicola TaxID=1095026 RepID=UPI000785636C|nr:hypothetical protein [Demequina sediminicola]
MTTAARPATSALTVAPRSEWEAQERAHSERADALTAGRRERAARGERHAIDDFLSEYYSAKPAQLRRWHPGVGVGLIDAGERSEWRWYRTDGDVSTLDLERFREDRGDAVTYMRRLLAAISGRAPMLGCFGMHEWAMVYRAGDDARRHGLPLRLGAEGTDAVVDAHPLVCTHIDAFRFFTPESTPLNEHQLTREDQIHMDQPGCLHVNMDVYKWAIKLGPAVPGDLLLDCFELARDVRQVDMQASPYDVSSYGLGPIPVETPEGKRDYAQRQREFSARGDALRARLIAVCDGVLAE